MAAEAAARHDGTLACLSELLPVQPVGGSVGSLHGSASLEHEVKDSVMATGPAQFPKGGTKLFLHQSTAHLAGSRAPQSGHSPAGRTWTFVRWSSPPGFSCRTVESHYKREDERTLLVQIEGPGCVVLRAVRRAGRARMVRNFPPEFSNRAPVQISHVAGIAPIPCGSGESRCARHPDAAIHLRQTNQ